MPSNPPPWPIEPARDPVDRELEPLLSEPLASAWAMDGSSTDPGLPRLRSRLLERSAASRRASAAMVTSRLEHAACSELACGVHAIVLYAWPGGRPLRPGEPLRARLIELQPGSSWQATDLAGRSEWLVLRGSVSIDGEVLDPRDYHVMPSGTAPAAVVATAQGARLFLRESRLEPAAGEAASTVRDADAGWPEYAPGIRRRVLWQRDGQAALLYHAQPGAAVPHHTHGHDEECLMVQGELFLDDLLLQEGDYQLAPAGTAHRITETDTGVVIYAHGDLDLKFVG